MTAAFDVAVVGAGPAGSSVAYHLAQLGWRVVVLERSSFPRDKACGDALTRDAVALLAEMGLANALVPFRRVHGMRIVTDAKGQRDARYPARDPRLPQYAVVIPRLDLDALVAQKAVEAGATLWQNTAVTGAVVHNGRVSGVKVRQQETETEVAATFVVAADGATSAFAGQKGTGLSKPDRWSIGYSMRGYFDRIGPLDDDDLFTFYLPLIDPETDRMLYGYGWVFPLAGGRANVGTGFFPSQRQDLVVNLRPVFDRFIEQLRGRDRRFTDMRLMGQLRGAPVHCSVKPSRSAAGRGVLLVGDAAGLVDPFTGEGIHSALESGKMAAQVLADALAAPDPMEADLSAYCRLLEARFDDRFRSGRNLVRKFGFVGRMLQNTFEIDHPLFDSVRSAITDFGLAENDGRDLFPADLVWLRNTSVADDVKRVHHRLAAIVQSEFPMLSRLSVDLGDSIGNYLRAHLVFLAGQFGRPDTSAGHAVATSIELAALALTVYNNVLERNGNGQTASTPASSSGARWGNMLTVMAGDYFLAKAYGLTSKLGSEFSRTVSQASSDVCVARMWQVGRAHHPEPVQDGDVVRVEKKAAVFFEIACRLGARTSGTSRDIVDHLADYGRNLGIAFSLTTGILDVLADCDEPLKHPIARLLQDGIYSWPVMLALRDDDEGYLRALLRTRPIGKDQVLQTQACLASGVALVRTLELAQTFASRAKSSLETVPCIQSRGILATMADFVVDRARNHIFLSGHAREAGRHERRSADRDLNIQGIDGTRGRNSAPHPSNA